MELMIEALRIPAGGVPFLTATSTPRRSPGADPMLVEKDRAAGGPPVGQYRAAQRDEPDHAGPRQKETAILRPMGQIAVQSAQSKKEMVLYRGAKPFAPAGQSTQMIIGRRRRQTAISWT